MNDNRAGNVIDDARNEAATHERDTGHATVEIDDSTPVADAIIITCKDCKWWKQAGIFRDDRPTFLTP